MELCDATFLLNPNQINILTDNPGKPNQKEKKKKIILKKDMDIYNLAKTGVFLNWHSSKGKEKLRDKH